MRQDPSAGCADLLVDRHVRDGLGHHAALIEWAPGGRRLLSYGELQHLSMAAAHELDILLAGSRRQQRIALVGSATLENLVYWLGALRAGHLPLLVRPDLPAADYAALWCRIDPRLVLADRTPCPIQADPMTGLEQLVGSVHRRDPDRPVSQLAGTLDRRPAIVLAGAGRTGRPTLCVHPHRSFWAFERSVTRRLWGLTGQDRVLAGTGPCGALGLHAVQAPLSVGATVVLLPHWHEPGELMHAIGAEAVTVLLAVPALLHRLLALHGGLPASLRLALCTGAALPQALRQRWEQGSGRRMLDFIASAESFLPYLSEATSGPPGLQPVGGFGYIETAQRSRAAPAFTLGLSEGPLMLGYLNPDAPESFDPAPAPLATGDLFLRTPGGLQWLARAAESAALATADAQNR